MAEFLVCDAAGGESAPRRGAALALALRYGVDADALMRVAGTWARPKARQD